jgi:hypothetical protein
VEIQRHFPNSSRTSPFSREFQLFAWLDLDQQVQERGFEQSEEIEWLYLSLREMALALWETGPWHSCDLKRYLVSVEELVEDWELLQLLLWSLGLDGRYILL